MSSGRFRRRAAVIVAIAIALAPWSARAQQDNTEAVYQDARRLFDALDYERAVVALDQAIAALESGPGDAARRERLATAYEMRARSKFGLGDQDGAKEDFIRLLKVSPSHTLSGQVSPRVVGLFEEIARDLLTTLNITLTPPTAKLAIDGVPLPGPGPTRVAVGEHVVSAEQPGYGAAKQTITAAAGVPSEVALTLERVSSVISIVSSPPNVQVMLDGTVVGRTAAPPEASGSATTSAPLVVSDVTNGSHTVELTRECFVTAVERVEVGRPDDYAIGPVALRPAVATLSVTADQSGAQVFVDGRDRGTAPVTLNDVCEGAHDVELRTKFGGDIRHIEVRAGEQVSVAGTLKPVFAIVSSSGVPVAAAQDLRTLVERALAPAKSVLLVAPPADLADKALKANRLPADWLATDAAGRTVEPPAQAGVSRKDASARLAETFRAQGVASVTALDASRLAVSLLGAGSRTPDVVEVALDSPRSIAAAVARLDRSQGLWQPTIGLQVIDIVDAAGPVVVEIDKGGPAGGASVQVGDVVTRAGGKPVADAAALMAVLASRRAGESVALDVRGSDGAVRRADVKVASAARVIPLHEQSLLANRVLVDLRAHLADASDPFEQSVLRLNLAVALARVGDWAGARDELQRVTLPDQRGVGAGTVQYLLGLAAHNLGNRAEAEAAFKAAAASDSLLTEDGPAVKDLAEAKLAEVAKGTQ